ncbi:class A beta-lactamase [Francisella sp. Scap27]|uniref:class A beta-lactamase n=1 Tax=Francisella sp. Scap27 TaxID=2589986 RepID=UPI0015BDEECC|nr:class A beta-lactamase [Francisella sp. Scap27]QLE78215.1 class A beta-lactamase [Francisella sp. Scap27]
MKTFFSLLLCIVTTSTFALSTDDIKLAKDIKKIEVKHGGKIGVYTINRNNWKNFSFQSSFYFPVCSTYKILVVGAILKQSMTDKNLLNEKIKISPNSIAGYSPITKKHLNKTMTVAELCHASILSDNTATNLLVEKLGGLEKLSEFNLSLGDHATKIADKEPEINDVNLRTNINKTTPKIMTRDINKLAFSNDILDKKHRLLFKKWLKDNDTGKNRITAGAPSNWLVGDKTGTCEYGTTNDVAIIWPNNSRAIAMSVFYTQTEKNAKPNEKIIKEVSQLVLKKLKTENSKK